MAEAGRLSSGVCEQLLGEEHSSERVSMPRVQSGLESGQASQGGP